MAVGLMFEDKAVTKAMYEAVLEEVMPGRVAAPGMLFHSGGPMPGGGWRVMETWESQAALDTFVEHKLGQALERAGITERPQTFEVESIVSAS
jgi:hypothetical protein